MGEQQIIDAPEVVNAPEVIETPEVVDTPDVIEMPEAFDNLIFAESPVKSEIRYFFSGVTTWFQDNLDNIFWGIIWLVFCLLLAEVICFTWRKIAFRVLRKRYPEATNVSEIKCTALYFFLIVLGMSLSLRIFNFPEKVVIVFGKIFFSLNCITFNFALLRALRAIILWGLAIHQKKNPKSTNTSKMIVDFSRSMIRLVVWCFTAIFLMQRVFLFNVSHLFVSAGIVGLGLAFAAQNTVANVFGAFSIIIGKMFTLGDRIRVNDIEGVVEKISFRSVQLRAFDGHLMNVPNRLIADSKVDNLTNRLFTREFFSYGLIYQTTPDQLTLALKILNKIGEDLRELMAKGKKVKFYFMTCNNSSLDVQGYVWFKDSDPYAVRADRSRFNYEVVKRFNEAGLEFAYPTSTVFLAKEDNSAQAGVAGGEEEEVLNKITFNANKSK